MKLPIYSVIYFLSALALTACGENPHVDVGASASPNAVAANQSGETASGSQTATGTSSNPQTNSGSAVATGTKTITDTTTATVTNTATVTATNSNSSTHTSTVTQTATATVTDTSTTTKTATVTNTSTATKTSTVTATATTTATATKTDTQTATVTDTATKTTTATVTDTATGTGTQVEPLGIVNFDFNSDKIRHSEVKALYAIIDYLRNHADVKLDIIGNTSDEGSESYNDNLSRKRAEAVREFLIRSGVEASRLKTLAHGEDNPLVPVTPNMTEKQREEAREKNRRVQVYIRQAD